MLVEMIPPGAVAEVERTFEQCQRRFPTIQLEFREYLAHAEGIVTGLLGVPSDETPDCEAWLAAFVQLHREDLFLALACARGERVAWEYFADDYLPALQRCALQACRNLHESEDLAQEIVARLLEGKGRLAGYNGRGSLAGWLKVSVAHAAVDRFRRGRREASLDELEGPQRNGAFSALAADSEKIEDGMDARWGPVLSGVLMEEIRRLPPRDRLLLGLYYLQGVPLKTIAGQFVVHEATVSRWLDGLRRGIRKRIERELRIRHGLRPREIQSLWHWFSQQEDISLEKVLGS